MKLPFIKYLEALVACRWDNETITEKLSELPIPLAKNFPESGIAMVRKVMAELDPEYFNHPFKSDYPNQEMLKSKGIFEVTNFLLKLDAGYNIDYIKGTFDLVNDPDMFQKMTSLAMANVTDEDIELLVRGKYNIHFNELEIKTFLHLFFNTTGWTLGDKKAYIEHIKDPELADYYEMAAEGDKAYLMWKLGIAPQISIEQMLHDLTSDAYYMFKEKSKYSPSEAQAWAGLVLRSVERAEKLNTDKERSSDFFKELNTLLDETGHSMEIKKKENTSEDLPHISEMNKE